MGRLPAGGRDTQTSETKTMEFYRPGNEHAAQCWKRNCSNRSRAVRLSLIALLPLSTFGNVGAEHDWHSLAIFDSDAGIAFPSED